MSPHNSWAQRRYTRAWKISCAWHHPQLNPYFLSDVVFNLTSSRAKCSPPSASAGQMPLKQLRSTWRWQEVWHILDWNAFVDPRTIESFSKVRTSLWRSHFEYCEMLFPCLTCKCFRRWDLVKKNEQTLSQLRALSSYCMLTRCMTHLGLQWLLQLQHQ